MILHRWNGGAFTPVFHWCTAPVIPNPNPSHLWDFPSWKFLNAYPCIRFCSANVGPLRLRWLTFPETGGSKTCDWPDGTWKGESGIVQHFSSRWQILSKKFLSHSSMTSIHPASVVSGAVLPVPATMLGRRMPGNFQIVNLTCRLTLH